MRTATAIGFGLICLMANLASAQEAAKKNEFEGAYTIEKGQDNGKDVPEEHIKGATVRITGDTIVVADKDEKELYVSKYTLDTAKKPTRINMTETGGPRGRKGEKAVGIIMKDGATVKLAYAYEGGIVPTSFETKAGEKQLCFTLKRKDGE